MPLSSRVTTRFGLALLLLLAMISLLPSFRMERGWDALFHPVRASSAVDVSLSAQELGIGANTAKSVAAGSDDLSLELNQLIDALAARRDAPAPALPSQRTPAAAPGATPVLATADAELALLEARLHARRADLDRLWRSNNTSRALFHPQGPRELTDEMRAAALPVAFLKTHKVQAAVQLARAIAC